MTRTVSDRWKFELPFRRKAKPDPPPAPVRVSPFGGVGLLTAHDPRAALRCQGLADWVAVKADGGDRADPSVVPELRAAGFRILVWEAENGMGQAAVARYGAEAWIAQSEGPGEHERALRAGVNVRVPKALVTNCWMPEWPGPDWACLPECYVNVNPQATPANMEYEARKRGAVDVFPCVASYNGAFEQPGGRKVPLSEYLTMPGVARDFSAYMAEYLDAADIEALRQRR